MNESIFIICENNNLYGWGWNEHGNFGTGDTHDLIKVTKLENDISKIYGNGAYTIIKF